MELTEYTLGTIAVAYLAIFAVTAHLLGKKHGVPLQLTGIWFAAMAFVLFRLKDAFVDGRVELIGLIAPAVGIAFALRMTKKWRAETKQT